MTSTPGRLRIGNRGRIRGQLHGDAKITYNEPFPTRNGEYGSGAMMGVVLHTEVGYDHNVVTEFNTRSAEASATVSIRFGGHLHQYGPIGLGWAAWAQEAGNLTWYSGETEDDGNPGIPMDDGQLWTWAQVLEVLSSFAGFPLRISDSVDRKGFGVHSMGGQEWGGHTCPDVPPKHVRSEQRPEIIARAKAIRDA
jgi:opacity protein-like surface antigen